MPARSVRLERSLITSSAYQAPNQLRQPSSVGFGSTENVDTLPCKNVVRLVNVAVPSRPEPVSSLSRMRWNQTPALN